MRPFSYFPPIGVLLVALLPLSINAQTILWQETFTGLANGTTSRSGAIAWNAYQGAPQNGGVTMLAVPVADRTAQQQWSVDNGTLLARDVSANYVAPGRTINGVNGYNVNYVVFETGAIDISSAAIGVRITVEIGAATTAELENDDYVRLMYSVDGGAFQNFAQNGLQRDDFGRLIGASSCSSLITGNSLVIRFEVANTTQNEFYRFDNITVLDGGGGLGLTVPGITHRSDESGNWNAGGTWDVGTVPVAASLVEITCGCVVNMTDDRSVRAVVVQPGAALVWTANNVELTFTNGADGALIINTGAAMGESILGSAGVTASQIYTDGASVLPITNNSSLVDIDRFDIRTANKPVTLSGIGVFEMRTLEFSGSGQTFTNNSTVLTDSIRRQNGETFTNGSFVNAANATLRLRGNNVTNIHNVINLTASAVGNTVIFERTGDQDIRRPVADTYYNLIFRGSGTKTTNTDFNGATAVNMTVLGNLTITDAAVLDVGTGNDNIILHGNWLNNSTAGTPFVAGIGGTEFVQFAGGNAQTVQRTGNTEAFNRITMAKTVGTTVTLNSPATVATAGVFTTGILNTTTANLLTFLDNATATGANNDSYVDGPVAKLGNDAFVFPTGDGNFYGGLGIPAPDNVADLFRAQYFRTAAPNANNLVAPLNFVSPIQYWSLAQTATAGAAENILVTLHWSNNGIANQVLDFIDISVARYNGANWVTQGLGTVTGTPLTAGTMQATVANNFATSPSDVTYGYELQPLPVEFLAFVGQPGIGVVDLQWLTANEQNNQGFWVERSADAQTFQRIGYVQAVAQPAATNDYAFADPGYAPGANFYRLAQVDFNGTITHSNVVEVLMPTAGPGAQQMALYPNPARWAVMVQLPSQSENIRWAITDLTGRTLATGQASAMGPTSAFAIDVTAYNLAVGSYMISVSAEGQRWTQNLVVQ